MTQPPDEPKVIAADVIEAGQIVLVDKLRKRRAEIACKSEEHCEGGYAVAQLFDGDGRPRITLQVSDDGANIQHWNRSNSPCITLNVADDRGTGVCRHRHPRESSISVGFRGN